MLALVSSASERFNALAVREKWPTLCDERLDFESDRLAELLDIWQGVRGTRPLPQRADFSARVLARHLRHLTFVERLVQPDGTRRYRFRLFGSALATHTGDLTGKFLDEAIPAVFLPSWTASYDTAIEMRMPLRFTARFRATHLEHIMAETLAAPLADASGAASGLLVSVNYSPVVA
jgi:hypothetical protein